MTQQALALLDERVSLPVIQILQLVYVVLALRLSLLHVDVRQHTLDDGDRFIQAGSVWVLRGSVFQNLFEKQWLLDQSRAWDVQEAPQVQLPAEGRLKAALQEVLHPSVLFLLVQQCLGC